MTPQRRRRLQRLKIALKSRDADRLRKLSVKSARELQQLRRKSKQSGEKMDRIKTHHAKKLATSTLPMVLKSLSVIDALNSVQRALRQDLGLPNLQLDQSTILSIVEGVLTVAISRAVLETISPLAASDKHKILDRIITRLFPVEDRKKPTGTPLKELAQLLQGNPAIGPYGLTGPFKPSLGTVKMPPRSGDKVRP